MLFGSCEVCQSDFANVKNEVVSQRTKFSHVLSSGKQNTAVWQSNVATADNECTYACNPWNSQGRRGRRECWRVQCTSKRRDCLQKKRKGEKKVLFISHQIQCTEYKCSFVKE